jgi:hypothetical protein
MEPQKWFNFHNLLDISMQKAEKRYFYKEDVHESAKEREDELLALSR